MRPQRWLLVALLIGVWVVMTSANLVNQLLIPSPQSVLKIAISLDQWKALGANLAATCLRLALGFALGGAVGIGFGVAMGRSQRIYDSLEFVVDFFRSIPVAALFPLFVVFFGIGNSSKIATAVWSTALIVLVNTMYGVRGCSPTRERFAKTLGASRLQVLRTIVIPEATPFIVAGLRTGLSIALIVVIMTEMFLGTSSGLGQRIYNAALLYNAPELYFTIGLTGLIGYVLNQAFVLIERRLQRWSMSATETM
jgi:ABC-type nitrate/sulfonate/bicarbonate transport system permease component